MRKKRAKCQHPPHRLYSWFASANNGDPRSAALDLDCAREWVAPAA